MSTVSGLCSDSYLEKCVGDSCGMFRFHGKSLHKLGEVVAHGKNIPGTMCGWSKRPNEVDAQMMPRRDNGYWVKLWSCLAYLPPSSLTDITSFNLKHILTSQHGFKQMKMATTSRNSIKYFSYLQDGSRLLLLLAI